KPLSSFQSVILPASRTDTCSGGRCRGRGAAMADHNGPVPVGNAHAAEHSTCMVTAARQTSHIRRRHRQRLRAGGGLRVAGAAGTGCPTLVFQRVPQVAVQVTKHRDRAVWLLRRWAYKLDTGSHKPMVVAPEVVRAQEQEDTPTRLVADQPEPLGRRGASQQQRCASGAARSDDHPTLVLLWLRVSSINSKPSV